MESLWGCGLTGEPQPPRMTWELETGYNIYLDSEPLGNVCYEPKPADFEKRGAGRGEHQAQDRLLFSLKFPQLTQQTWKESAECLAGSVLGAVCGAAVDGVEYGQSLLCTTSS